MSLISKWARVLAIHRCLYGCTYAGIIIVDDHRGIMRATSAALAGNPNFLVACAVAYLGGDIRAQPTQNA